MKLQESYPDLQAGTDREPAAHNYIVDACQGTILCTDTLRKRGDMYLDHVNDCRSPVLVFEIANCIAKADLKVGQRSNDLLAEIQHTLNLKKPYLQI